jgi:hypothetical protein
MLEASCDSSTHSSRTLLIIYPGLYINGGPLTYPNDLMIQAVHGDHNEKCGRIEMYQKKFYVA